MRLSNGGSNTASMIGRRRGTRRKTKSSMTLNRSSILVLLALCGTVFAAGILVGTGLFGAPRADGTSDGGEGEGRGHSEVSPLAAATSKLAPSDAIQKLIIESAQAERYEREEHLLEAEARKRGDKKLAAHLRGALAPGDKNYNPHHHVDDFAGDDGEGGGAAAGDGAAYAGGGDGNGGGEHREERNMHNHFMEALKQDVHHLKQGKDKVVESIKESIKQKVRHAQEMVHPPPPDGGPEDPATHGDDEVIHGDVHGDPFPHMARPVDPDHDFSRWEPPGGSRFAEYKGGDAPYRITRKTLQQSDEVARSRRVHVLGAMKHIWKNYKVRTPRSRLRCVVFA